jgi:hypothetical protein
LRGTPLGRTVLACGNRPTLLHLREAGCCVANVRLVDERKLSPCDKGELRRTQVLATSGGEALAFGTSRPAASPVAGSAGSVLVGLVGSEVPEVEVTTTLDESLELGSLVVKSLLELSVVVSPSPLAAGIVCGTTTTHLGKNHLPNAFVFCGVARMFVEDALKGLTRKRPQV